MAHIRSRGENCRNVAGRMHREVVHRPSRGRRVGLHGMTVALHYRQRTLRTVLKDGCKSLLENDDLVTRGAHLCNCLTNDREIQAVAWRGLPLPPAGNEKRSRQTK